MNVHQPNPPGHQFMTAYELKDLVVRKLRGLRQGLKQRQYFLAIANVSACQFPDHERMAHYLLFQKQIM